MHAHLMIEAFLSGPNIYAVSQCQIGGGDWKRETW